MAGILGAEHDIPDPDLKPIHKIGNHHLPKICLHGYDFAEQAPTLINRLQTRASRDGMLRPTFDIREILTCHIPNSRSRKASANPAPTAFPVSLALVDITSRINSTRSPI